MAAVHRYEILDTPPDGSFDRVTAMAARRFDVPIAIISIVDHDRIWFKSHHGVDVEEIGRDPGLCASAILSDEAHILLDAGTDPPSLANPLVAGDFGLRFYAGVPLQTADGFNLGTLCVIDKEPRPVEQGQIDDLKDLASLVVDQLELRLAARTAIAHAELMAREIDHRVMNSLQFVSGLLTMQSGGLASTGDASTRLKEAATRVAAVAESTGTGIRATPIKSLALRSSVACAAIFRTFAAWRSRSPVTKGWSRPLDPAYWSSDQRVGHQRGKAWRRQDRRNLSSQRRSPRIERL